MSSRSYELIGGNPGEKLLELVNDQKKLGALRPARQKIRPAHVAKLTRLRPQITSQLVSRSPFAPSDIFSA